MQVKASAVLIQPLLSEIYRKIDSIDFTIPYKKSPPRKLIFLCQDIEFLVSLTIQNGSFYKEPYNRSCGFWTKGLSFVNGTQKRFGINNCEIKMYSTFFVSHGGLKEQCFLKKTFHSWISEKYLVLWTLMKETNWKIQIILKFYFGTLIEIQTRTTQ